MHSKHLDGAFKITCMRLFMRPRLVAALDHGSAVQNIFSLSELQSETKTRPFLQVYAE